MEERFTTNEGLDTCAVCHMDIPDISKAVTHEDPVNRELLVFCSETCFKQYLEDPSILNEIDEEEAE
jgi:hypothetical protein